MNKVLLSVAIALSCASTGGFALPSSQLASTTPKLFYFSPQGEVTKVRQVVARFSEPMTAFGDPRGPEPFVIDCAEKGQPRWVDTTTWVYDFERDLPADQKLSFIHQYAKYVLGKFSEDNLRSF